MQFTPSELQAINHAYYELSALQVQVQLLRLELLAKANFNPNQPRVPRGNHDGGQWTRVGARASGTPARTGADATGVKKPPPRSGIETTILPGDRRVVRDRSGTEPWEAYFETLRPDGSVAERFVVNRDGSGIRSQYATTPELTGWDESHTIVGAGGETLTCQNLGKTQTILDPTGEVIQIASWKSSGPEIEYIRPDLGFDRPDGLLGRAVALGLLLPLFAWFTSTAEPNRAAVFALRARDYRKPTEQSVLEPLFVGELGEAEVNAACKSLELVQGLTNEAAEKARSKGPYSSPAVYGTAVHTRLKEAIKKLANPNLHAEISFLKSATVRYGKKGSIRIDVFDNTRGDDTVCVYDIKTGDEGLSGPRFAEIAKAVRARFPETRRIIIIEVRPTS
jgi:hypothetical protein